MTPERWKQIDELAQAALEQPPEDRAAFLAQVCAGDEALHNEVRSLISYQSEAIGFLEQPALDHAAELVAAPQQKLVEGSEIGHYQIIRLLGEGGMGEVYLARDRKLGRQVALKLLPEEFMSERQRVLRFEQEASAASALNHPNILTIYEIGESSGRHFISTEFIEGQTLRDRLRTATMSIVEVLDVARQVASALAAAHEVGIIHRDIKPENIMVRRDGLVKVLDFGLAKLTNQQATGPEATTRALVQTGAGIVMGTVRYMSPEQARGLEIDARSDIWSLGCVIYEMVAGRLPFDGATASDVISLVLQKEAPPLARYSPEVPAELDRIVTKSLQKTPEERFQLAKDLVLDLKSLKQQLEFQAERERGVTPGIMSVPTDANRHAISSADYLVNKVKRHKRAILFLAPLGIAIAIVAYVALPRYFAKRQVAVPPSTSADMIRSIAVLPFANTSGNPETEYLSDGISESLINSLSQLPGVKVIHRSSTFKYKGKDVDLQEVANSLDVEGVLTGRVSQRGENLEINVELVNARDKTQIWGEKYDRRSTDVLAVLSEISREIAQTLRLRLTPSEQQKLTKRHTSNTEAYNYYAKAMYHFHNIGPRLSSRSEADLAVELFKKAIELDPEFALAHARIGYAYTKIAVFQEDNPGLIERAKQELGVAERLDPQLPEVHLARYFIVFSQYDGWNVGNAIRELRLAQQLDPNAGHPELGDLYSHIGLEQRALEAYEFAMKIDPENDEVKHGLVSSFFISARPDEGLEASKKYLNSGPDLRYFLEKRMIKEAESIAEEEYRNDPTSIWRYVYRVLLMALQGKHREAQAAIPSILERERRYRGYHHDTYNIARIYALGGKSDEALKWLRMTVAEGFPCYPLFARDPFLDQIREDSAFKEFMSEMKARWEGYQRGFG